MIQAFLIARLSNCSWCVHEGISKRADRWWIVGFDRQALLVLVCDLQLRILFHSRWYLYRLAYLFRNAGLPGILWVVIGCEPAACKLRTVRERHDV